MKIGDRVTMKYNSAVADKGDTGKVLETTNNPTKMARVDFNYGVFWVICRDLEVIRDKRKDDKSFLKDCLYSIANNAELDFNEQQRLYDIAVRGIEAQENKLEGIKNESINLTKDLYFQFRKKGKVDQEIAQIIGFSASAVSKWKKRNG
ncbi:hypothetical protein, partial [Listeria valentina]|uniref:hypothetical protein n=1 Tax=Listeria valentina TaxID=2705293 RepID=UPI00142F915D